LGQCSYIQPGGGGETFPPTEGTGGGDGGGTCEGRYYNLAIIHTGESVDFTSLCKCGANKLLDDPDIGTPGACLACPESNYFATGTSCHCPANANENFVPGSCYCQSPDCECPTNSIRLTSSSYFVTQEGLTEGVCYPCTNGWIANGDECVCGGRSEGEMASVPCTDNVAICSDLAPFAYVNDAPENAEYLCEACPPGFLYNVANIGICVCDERQGWQYNPGLEICECPNSECGCDDGFGTNYIYDFQLQQCKYVEGGGGGELIQTLSPTVAIGDGGGGGTCEGRYQYLEYIDGYGSILHNQEYCKCRLDQFKQSPGVGDPNRCFECSYEQTGSFADWSTFNCGCPENSYPESGYCICQGDCICPTNSIKLSEDSHWVLYEGRPVGACFPCINGWLAIDNRCQCGSQDESQMLYQPCFDNVPSCTSLVPFAQVTQGSNNQPLCEPCPPGFMFHPLSQTCVCNQGEGWNFDATEGVCYCLNPDGCGCTLDNALPFVYDINLGICKYSPANSISSCGGRYYNLAVIQNAGILNNDYGDFCKCDSQSVQVESDCSECSNRYHYQDYQGSCRCPEDTFPQGEFCVCINVDNCICPTNSIILQSDSIWTQNPNYFPVGMCFACQNGWVAVGNRCVCDNEYEGNMLSVECNNAYNQVSLEFCSVSEFVYYNNEGGQTPRCEPCPRGFVMDPQHNTCVCSQENGWTWDDFYGECTCFNQFGDNGCQCPLGYTYDEQLQTCKYGIKPEVGRFYELAQITPDGYVESIIKRKTCTWEVPPEFSGEEPTQCIPCENGGIPVQTFGNMCDCPQNADYYGGSIGCVCNENLGECRCPTNYAKIDKYSPLHLQNNEEYPIGKCYPCVNGWVAAGNQCECMNEPDDLAMIGSSISCEIHNSNQPSDDYPCDKYDFVYHNDLEENQLKLCEPCPSGFILHPTEKKCVCSVFEGWTFDQGGTCYCSGPDCGCSLHLNPPAPYVFDERLKVCMYVDGCADDRQMKWDIYNDIPEEIFATTCVCTPYFGTLQASLYAEFNYESQCAQCSMISNRHFIPINRVIEFDQDYYLETFCSCPENADKDENFGVCRFSPDSGPEDLCPTNYIKATSQSNDFRRNQIPEDGDMCFPCPGGWVSYGDRCYCPSQETEGWQDWSPPNFEPCVPLPIDSSEPCWKHYPWLAYNEYTGQCEVCPLGFLAYQGKCVCPSEFFFNENENTCECQNIEGCGCDYSFYTYDTNLLVCKFNAEYRDYQFEDFFNNQFIILQNLQSGDNTNRKVTLLSDECECPYFEKKQSTVIVSQYVMGIYDDIRYCRTESPTTLSPFTSSPTASPTTRCTAPNLLSARLSDSVDTLILTFSSDTNRAGLNQGDNDCTSILTLESVELLGVTNEFLPICIWNDLRTLSASIEANSEISVGDIVGVQDNIIIRSGNDCDQALVDGFVPVELPLNPPTVSASLSSQSAYGSCNTIIFDARESSGAAGRALEFSWSLISLTPATNPGGLAALTSIIGSETSSILTIPPADLEATNSGGSSLELTVSVTVRNWLLTESTKELTVTVQTAYDIPPVSLDGPTERTVSRSDIVTIATSILPLDQTSTCTEELVLYSWSTGELFGYEYTSSSITIPSFTLEAGNSYDITFHSRYESAEEGDGEATGTVTLTVVASPPEINIKRCDRAVTIDNAGPIVVLDARETKDPDDVSSGTTNFEFSWGCERVNLDETTMSCGLDDFLDESGPQLYVDQTHLELTNQTEASGLVIDLTDDDIVYRILLTVTHKITGLSSSQTCEIWTRPALVRELWVEQAGAIGTVSLEANGTNLLGGPGSFQNDVVLLNDPTLDQVEYIWKCELLDTSPCPLDMSNTDFVLTSSTDRILVLNDGYLVSGVTYRFFVTAIDDSNGELATAFGQLEIERPPSLGICTVTPSSGIAFIDIFVFECSGWTGGNTLTYEFSSGSTILRSFTLRSSFTTTLSADQTLITATIANEFNKAVSVDINVNLDMVSIDIPVLLQQALFVCGVGDLQTTTTKVTQVLNLLKTENTTVFEGYLPELINISICVKNAAPVTTAFTAMKVSLFASILVDADDRNLLIPREIALESGTCIQSLLTDVESAVADYSIGFGSETACAISGLIATSEAQTDALLANKLHDSIQRLGRALSETMVPFQATETISCRGVLVSAYKQEADPQTASNNILTIQHKVASNFSASVRELYIADITLRPLFVLSSSKNYWPQYEEGFPRTDLLSLSLFNYESGVLLEPETIQTGLQVYLNVVAASKDGVISCTTSGYYGSDPTNTWENNTCTYSGETFGGSTSKIGCKCDTLPSVQAQEVVYTTPPTSRDERIFYAISILLLLIYITYGGLQLSSYRSEETLVLPGQKDKRVNNRLARIATFSEHLNDFLLQWYFYLPIRFRSEKPFFARRADACLKKLRNAKHTKSVAVSKVAISLWEPSGFNEVDHVRKKQSIVDLEVKEISDDIPDNEMKVIERIMQHEITSRTKQSIRGTGNEAGAVLLESQRRERRFLNRAVQFLNTAEASEADIERVRYAGWGLREKTCAQQREWIRRRKQQRKERGFLLFWKNLILLNHEWVSIYHHRRLDPYSSVWRTNVLLVAMLLNLLLCIMFLQYLPLNGTTQFICVSILTAIVVSVISVLVMLLGREMSYLQWEIRLLNIRSATCHSDESENDSAEDTKSHTYTFADKETVQSGSSKTAQITQNKIRTLRMYQMGAWAGFISVCAFITAGILYLGYVPLDVPLELIFSVVVAEVLRASLISLGITYLQARILFGQGMALNIKNLCMHADNYRPIKAFKVYIRVMRGYRLKRKYALKLKELIQKTRDMVLRGLTDVKATYTSKGSVMLSFSLGSGILNGLVSGDSLLDSGKSNGSEKEIYKTIEVKEKGNASRGEKESLDGDAEDPPIPPLVTDWKKCLKFNRGNPLRLDTSRLVEEILEADIPIIHPRGRRRREEKGPSLRNPKMQQSPKLTKVQPTFNVNNVQTPTEDIKVQPTPKVVKMQPTSKVIKVLPKSKVESKKVEQTLETRSITVPKLKKLVSPLPIYPAILPRSVKVAPRAPPVVVVPAKGAKRDNSPSRESVRSQDSFDEMVERERKEHRKRMRRLLNLQKPPRIRVSPKMTPKISSLSAKISPALQSTKSHQTVTSTVSTFSIANFFYNFTQEAAEEDADSPANSVSLGGIGI